MTKGWSEQNAGTLGELSAKVDYLIAESIKVGEAIYGNGDPSKGMSSRMERMELNLTNASDVCTANAKSLGELAKSVHTLTTSVDAHHKSVHLANLLKDFKFWGLLISGIAILVVVVHDVFSLPGSPSLAESIWKMITGFFL